jgi:hypothetical protein
VVQKVSNDQVFPNFNDPFVEVDTSLSSGNTGVLRMSWRQFLQTLWRRVGSGGNAIVQNITPTNPMTFVASVPGTLYVLGGTVSLLQLQRKGISAADLFANTPILLSQGDSVLINYSVAPSVVFVPI